MVPIPHGAVWDIRKASDEIGKLFKSSSLRDEVLLAREAKIGFVLDEIVIGSDISHSAPRASKTSRMHARANMQGAA